MGRLCGPSGGRLLTRLGLHALLLTRIVLGAPELMFPFNDQLPPVARAGKPFSFQFAPSTFVSRSDSELQYTLLGAPSWIQLDSRNRRLSGIPTGMDGFATFVIEASDGTGAVSTNCRLLVSSQDGPTVTDRLDDQMQLSYSLAGPATVAIQPGSHFELSFSRSTFGDLSSSPPGSFRVTLADRTPLPAWLRFNPATLQISGTAPADVAGPQEYRLLFILVQPEGFAAAEAGFTIVASSHTLAFKQYRQSLILNARTPGTSVPMDSRLVEDGTNRTLSGPVRFSVELPNWMTFRNGHFFVPTAMPDSHSQIATAVVTVLDEAGAAAVATVSLLVNPVLFTTTIRPLFTTRGSSFSYRLPARLVRKHNIDLNLVTAQDWLHFDPKSLTLSGQVPKDFAHSMVPARMVAKEAKTGDREEMAFHIRIGDSDGAEAGSDLTDLTEMERLAGQTESDGSKGRKIVILVAIASTSVAILIGVLLLCWCRVYNIGFWKRNNPAPTKTAHDFHFPDNSSLSSDEEQVVRPARLLSTPAPQITMDLSAPVRPQNGSWTSFYSALSHPRRGNVAGSSSCVSTPPSTSRSRKTIQKPSRATLPRLHRPQHVISRLLPRSKSSLEPFYSRNAATTSSSSSGSKRSKGAVARQAVTESDEDLVPPKRIGSRSVSAGSRLSLGGRDVLSMDSRVGSPALLRGSHSPFFAAGGDGDMNGRKSLPTNFLTWASAAADRPELLSSFNQDPGLLNLGPSDRPIARPGVAGKRFIPITTTVRARKRPRQLSSSTEPDDRPSERDTKSSLPSSLYSQGADGSVGLSRNTSTIDVGPPGLTAKHWPQPRLSKDDGSWPGLGMPINLAEMEKKNSFHSLPDPWTAEVFERQDPTPTPNQPNYESESHPVPSAPIDPLDMMSKRMAATIRQMNVPSLTKLFEAKQRACSTPVSHRVSSGIRIGFDDGSVINRSRENYILSASTGSASVSCASSPGFEARDPVSATPLLEGMQCVLEDDDVVDASQPNGGAITLALSDGASTSESEAAASPPAAESRWKRSAKRGQPDRAIGRSRSRSVRRADSVNTVIFCPDMAS